jgi:hypothetical protein
MTRTLALVLSACACTPEPDTDPVQTVIGGTLSPTTTPSESETHRLLWQVDGTPPVERFIFGESVYLHTAAGTGCAPTALVLASAGSPAAESLSIQLHFPELPVPGVEAPLPAAVQRDVNDPFAPYFVPVALDDYAILGGTVRVEDFDDQKWRFRFEGEELANCKPVTQPCTPIADATLTIEPVGSGTMPALLDTPCIDAAPFPWPDGWDGCAVPTSSDVGGSIYDEGTCPSPMPW